MQDDVCTIGQAKFKGLEFYTLELPWRENKKNISRIRPGVYKAIKYNSPRFKREVLLLENKNGRINVEMHAGNFVEDTNGCILPGMTLAEDQQSVWRSNEALNEILKRMIRKEVIVRIEDSF
jgi:hypothetical protein